MSNLRLKKKKKKTGGNQKLVFIKTLPKKKTESPLLGDKPMVQFPKLVYFLNQNNSLLKLIASINWFNS